MFAERKLGGVKPYYGMHLLGDHNKRV